MLSWKYKKEIQKLREEIQTLKHEIIKKDITTDYKTLLNLSRLQSFLRKREKELKNAESY